MAQHSQTTVCICIVVVALIFATTSLVISIMILAYPSLMAVSDTSSDDMSVTPAAPLLLNADLDKEKVYVFAYDVPWGEYQYINEEGVLRGVAVELVDAICKEAGQSCRHIVVPIEYCWNNDDNVGTGILSGWFDACAIFLRTIKRENVFRFSGRLLRAKRGQFYVRESNPYSTHQLRQLNAAFRKSWYVSPECMARNKLGKPKNITIAKDYEEMKHLVLSDQVDVVFAEEGTFDNVTSLKSFASTYDCALGGSGVMHTVDSDIPDWFDTAAENLRRIGTIRDICSKYPSVDNCLD